MRQITVNVVDLKETLLQNRAKHVEQFEKALDRFRDEAIKVFEKNIEQIREGGDVREYLNLPRPENHVDDYDVALEMLEWHEDQTIALPSAEFRQYVKDDWGWKMQFTATASNYLSQDELS